MQKARTLGLIVLVFMLVTSACGKIGQGVKPGGNGESTPASARSVATATSEGSGMLPGVSDVPGIASSLQPASEGPSVSVVMESQADEASKDEQYRIYLGSPATEYYDWVNHWMVGSGRFLAKIPERALLAVLPEDYWLVTEWLPGTPPNEQWAAGIVLAVGSQFAQGVSLDKSINHVCGVYLNVPADRATAIELAKVVAWLIYEPENPDLDAALTEWGQIENKSAMEENPWIVAKRNDPMYPGSIPKIIELAGVESGGNR